MKNAYFVEYNGKYVASYNTIRGAIGYVNRKNLRDDADNTLRIVDSNGDMYNTISGNKL